MKHLWYVDSDFVQSMDEIDDLDVVFCDRDGIIVQADAGQPIAHRFPGATIYHHVDGKWISESGDETYIANGCVVDDIIVLADACGFDLSQVDGIEDYDEKVAIIEDWLESSGHVF